MVAALPTIETSDLCVGMFVHLDLGWMSHPFALSSFRIADAGQIATIRSLGLSRVRWSPEKSDLGPAEGAAAAEPASVSTEVATLAPPTAVNAPQPSGQRERAIAYHRRVDQCQRQYGEATAGWRQVVEQTASDPVGAGRRLDALSRALVDKMLGQRDLCIRVVTEAGAERASHALNVAVIALLMGKLAGLAETDMHDLGVGALGHDLGKLDIPARLHRLAPDFSSSESALYREHVVRGVQLGQRMGLTPGALLVIAQHHEHCDGSGFPRALDADRISTAARLVALVNRYDNLCHASRASLSLTPHEALSQLFTHSKRQFDSNLLTGFVRMMGVYPPGSVVQLTDDRYGLVDSVNSSRPLKPRVLVYDPRAAREDTLALDLEDVPALGIRRSLPASQLPAAVAEFLLPSPRLGWYFEGSESSEGPTGGA